MSQPPEPLQSRSGEPVGVTVRYWASARAAAGCEADTVAGGCLADVLAEIRAAHKENPRFAQVVSISSFLLNEQPVGSQKTAEVAVRPGDVVDVLPPFAGG